MTKESSQPPREKNQWLREGTKRISNKQFMIQHLLMLNASTVKNLVIIQMFVPREEIRICEGGADIREDNETNSDSEAGEEEYPEKSTTIILD